jgi:methyl-accepting chemotaxis protein
MKSVWGLIMDLHSIRVKSSLPMLIQAFTFFVVVSLFRCFVVSMFSYLSGLQKSALAVQADNFLQAI